MPWTHKPFTLDLGDKMPPGRRYHELQSVEDSQGEVACAAVDREHAQLIVNAVNAWLEKEKPGQKYLKPLTTEVE